MARARILEKGCASEDELKEIEKAVRDRDRRGGRVRAGRPGARSVRALDRHLPLNAEETADDRASSISRFMPSDPQRAIAFLREVFGWKFQPYGPPDFYG